MVLAQLLASGLDPQALPLPLRSFRDVSTFNFILGHPMVKSLLPFPIIAAAMPPLWWMFHKTWKALDAEATEARLVMRDRNEYDLRPMACLVLTAMILTVQEYYGGRKIYDSVIKPEIFALDAAGWTWLKAAKYDQLYGYVWWVAARVIGYVIVPVIAWRILFPKDNLLDYGLRIKGFIKHLWIYGVFLAIVLPVMLIVSQQPDFGSYYPFYKLSSRSWFDFLAWESIYWIQFFALEFFFRGWIVGALRRSMGASAIVVMTVPYCMIHYGKPYLEAHGAILAGIVLGSLAMRTRSVYSGFLLHISVALGMDLLSLYKRDALPSVFWGPG